MEIVQMSKDTWRIEDDGVRFFLLAGEERALLIDSGMNVHNADEIARQLVSLPVELLNTHADRDHVGSNGRFDSFYMHPAEASNYYNTQKKTGCMRPVEHGDVIDLGNRPLEIILIPGHTPGSIAVLDVRNRILFSGDSVQDGNIYMFGVQREFHAYMLSLKRLQEYRDRFDAIYPSHGSIPVKPELIPKLYDGAARVLDGSAPFEEVEVHGTTVRRYDAGCAGFLCGY